MALYGKNLLPAWNTTDWSIGSSHGESISGGYFYCQRYGEATYVLNTTTQDVSENNVYYNVGDSIKISWAGATARFILNILYWDTETSEGFNCAVTMTVGSGSAEIALQSASVANIKFVVYRIDTAGESNASTTLRIGQVKAQFQSTPNTSGETSTATLAGGGTGVDNTSVSSNTFFGGPSSGTSGRASFRSLVLADLPLSVKYNNTAKSQVNFSVSSSVLNITFA